MDNRDRNVPYTSLETKTIKFKNIVFILTEHCNFACKYCYMLHKNDKSVMTFETAKKVVDYALANFTEYPIIKWDFLGGEPFLEVELMEQICDYIEAELERLGHPWKNKSYYAITTNGLLYDTEKVQNFIKKHHKNTMVGISLDGTETKHDMQRIWPDGRGTYQDVVKNIPLWLEQFPTSNVKSTFASDDLPYLKDSIVHLWDLGIKEVYANVVYEDLWREGDDLILEEQLKALADYIIDNELWESKKCGFFDIKIGTQRRGRMNYANWCSAGEMMGVDTQGNFYPCFRFAAYCLENRGPLIVGNAERGINEDLLRPFHALTAASQSTQECKDCPVSMGCGWCQSFNYDQADTDTVYQRAIYICKIHKARCRANDYYWARLKKNEKFRAMNPDLSPFYYALTRSNHLYILLENDAVAYCNYKKDFTENKLISLEDFKKALNFARQNFWVPVLVHGKTQLPAEYEKELEAFDVMRIFPAGSEYGNAPGIIVYDNQVAQPVKNPNSVLLVNNAQIPELPAMLEQAYQENIRVNVIFPEMANFTESDFAAYGKALDAVAELLLEKYLKNGQVRELNLLTDALVAEEMKNCNAGLTNMTFAPDGKLYLCPAFYYNHDNEIVAGDVVEGYSIKNKRLLELENAPICAQCEAYHCRRCLYNNKCGTREYNTPTQTQCKVSLLERQKSYQLQQKMLELGLDNYYTKNVIQDLEYSDPLQIIRKIKKGTPYSTLD